VLYISIYLTENLRNPVGVAYVSELFHDNVLTTALSTNSQAKSLLAALMAPILGFLADQYGVGISLSVLAFIIIVLSPFFFAKKEDT